MKCKIIIVCAVILIGTLGIISPCSAESSDDTVLLEDIKKETRDLLQALNSYSVDQRDKAIRKTKAALDNLDKRIDKMEVRLSERWDEMDRVTREKARSSLRELREKRTQAAEWYGSLKHSTADAWEHMKKGLSEAYSSLNDAWERAEKEFDSDK